MATTAEQFQHIPLAEIDEDIENHRLVSDPRSDEQLLQSVRDNGIQQPVKVSRKDDGRFTLVFGFRRKAAAAAAGLDTIPAIVAENLPAERIRALQAIENLERRDLHPLEEARFCHDLAETVTADHGDSDCPSDLDVAEAVSQRIGRSKKWVEHRLNLARLSERVQQAFMDGDIHLGHAQLIGRLVSHEAQEEVLGRVQAWTPTWMDNAAEHRNAPGTIADTRRLVEAHLRDLSDVAWKLDQEFDGKVACTACPHNSANRLELFDADQPKKPQCLDAECFAEKNRFTSRAVVRATNTLLKSGAKPTPAQARKAVEEREVEFVEPRAVAAAAKRRQNPAKPTAREQHGQQDQERRIVVDNRLRKLTREWSEKVDQEINEYLPFEGPDGGLAMLVLIGASGVIDCFDPRPWQTVKKADQEKAQADLEQALELVKSAYDPKQPAGETPIIRLSRLLHPWFKRTLDDSPELGLEALALNFDSGRTRQTLCKAFGIDTHQFGPRPTRKAVEAELYPPPKGKTSKKKKGKKKARKKGDA